MCYCVIETSSDLLQISLVIFGNLQKFSENVRKRLSDNFWRIFGDFRKVFGNLRKIVKKVVISMFI